MGLAGLLLLDLHRHRLAPEAFDDGFQGGNEPYYTYGMSIDAVRGSSVMSGSEDSFYVLS